MDQVRDRRHAAWFWMDKSLIDEYGRDIGPLGIAVYAALARCANEEGHAIPSFAYLAQKLGMSRSSVIRQLCTLERVGLIDRKSRSSDHHFGHASNLYVLLNVPNDPSAPPAPPSVPQTPPSVPQTPPSVPQTPPSVPQTPPSVPQTPHLVSHRHPPSVPQTPRTRTIEQERKEGGSTEHCLTPVSAPIPPEPEVSHSRPTKQRTPIPDGDWLQVFLQHQDFVPVPFSALNDENWWACLSHYVVVFDEPLLQREFAKMGEYFIRNPNRMPRVPSGWKGFINRWFKRLSEDERKRYATQPAHKLY